MPVKRFTSEDIIRICEHVAEMAASSNTFDEQWESFGLNPDDAARVMILITDYPADRLRNELEQKIAFAFSLGLEIGKEIDR